MLNFWLICSSTLAKDIHTASAFPVLEIHATASRSVLTTYVWPTLPAAGRQLRRQSTCGWLLPVERLAL